jgi:hypothetical protein
MIEFCFFEDFVAAAYSKRVIEFVVKGCFCHMVVAFQQTGIIVVNWWDLVEVIDIVVPVGTVEFAGKLKVIELFVGTIADHKQVEFGFVETEQLKFHWVDNSFLSM